MDDRTIRIDLSLTGIYLLIDRIYCTLYADTNPAVFALITFII